MLYITQYEQEGSGIQWSNVFVPPVEAEIFNVGVTCIFLLIDSILYGVIGVTVIFIKDLKGVRRKDCRTHSPKLQIVG